MRLRPLALTSALLSIAALPHGARAYSDPERFMEPADEGGGGGRFFTGSPRDGYTCAVCHRGGAAPAVTVLGLPKAGYVPAQLVEAELSLRGDPRNQAVALEVVDSAGKDLGLELVPEAEIAPEERCGAVPGGRRASYLSQVGDRRVLGLEACEAKAVRFRFRAPQADRAILAATVLASDSSANVDGDGVVEITDTFYRDGRAARAARTGCSVTHGAPAVWSSLVLLTTLLLRARARLKRREPRVSAS